MSFAPTQAVRLARLLDAFGVDLIEVGHPVVSEQDRRNALAICRLGLRAQTLAHARATPEDVEAAAAVGAQWVGVFAGINSASLRYKLRRRKRAALWAVRTAVRDTKRLGLRVRFTCEDAFRTPLPRVMEVFEVARAAGADRLSYADTVGVMTPARMRAAIRCLRKRFGAVLHAHCHNDFGLATANALSALEGGAIGVDVSIEGVGGTSSSAGWEVVQRPRLWYDTAMKVAVFSAKPYDRQFLGAANAGPKHHLQFFEPHLSADTSALAAGFPAVCVFVHDRLDAPVLQQLAQGGTRLIALRCAGFNNVDLEQAEKLGLTVARVPAYSPYAVAEHAVGLILALNRKIHRAHARVREGNLALEGLLGADLHGQTVGVIGTGKIGAVFARIMNGFGCRLLAYDPVRNPECESLGVRYAELAEVFAQSDIISLHCPLTPQTRHLIGRETLRQMKRDVMIINTSRGAVIDTKAVIEALKSGKVGALGLDVYEEEADLFFEDLSSRVIQDDVFARLLTFPNVIITGHQAFFTRNAMEAIAETTLANITAFERGQPSGNEVTVSKVRKADEAGRPLVQP